MTRAFKPVCLITVLALVLALGAAIVPIGYTQAAGGTYYVDASVVGPGSGTSGDPWKTITTALATVPGGDTGNPDVINVAAGTYDAANGETFPLSFDNEGVTLQATGAATIDGGSSATIIDINEEGIVIDGFTITNSTSDATYGVYADVGGFEVLDNTFSNVDYGVYLDIDESESDLDADYTIGHIVVSGNTFSFNNDGVYMYLSFDFDDTVTGLTCDIGDIEVSDNDFYDGSTGIYCYTYGVADLTDSTATVGDLVFNDNTFNGLSSYVMEIYPWGFWYLEGDTTITCGDLEMNGNTSDGGDGFYIYWEYIGYGMYDTASVTVGDSSINDNDITSSDYGMYLYNYENGYDLYNDASVILGELHIEGNTIDSYEEALYFEFEEFPYYMYDDSSFEMGDAFIADNDITSTDDYGIYIYYYDYYVASYMEDNAQATLPDWNITGNTFDTYEDGIYFYTYSNPYDNYGYAAVDFGGFFINENTFDCGGYGIYLEYDDFVEGGYENSSCTLGDITITNNEFNTIGEDAVWVYLGELGYDLEDDATLTVGDVTITGNTVTEGNWGLCVEYDEGAETYDSSSVEIGSVTISENEVSGTSEVAISVYYDFDYMTVDSDSTQTYGDITISDNVIDDCAEGILVWYYMDVSGSSPETATFGELDITDNEVSTITHDDGIDIEYGLYAYDDVTLNVGRALVEGNTVSDCASSAFDFDMYIYEGDYSTVNLGDPEINENTFQDSADGIWFWGVQNAEVTNNEILNNEGEETCGIYIEDSYDWYHEGTYPDFPAMNNVFRCNNIEGNEPYGLENDGTGEVDAEGNWWGDASGPSGEGPGDGDAVSDNVDYEPWLEAPCGEELPPIAAARANPPMGQAPHVVQFFDMSTGEIDTWFWSFGDGSFSDAQYPVHTYQNEGTFEVCLTVEGPGGEDTVCMQVLVEPAAGLPNLVVRNLYISATQAQPRQQVMITADVFNEGTAWGDGEIQLLINGQYEQSAQVGVAAGTSQPISFTVYKVEAGEYQVVVGNAMGTFYVVEEPQPSQVGGIPMDSGTLIALIVIGIFVIAALIVAIVVFKPS